MKIYYVEYGFMSYKSSNKEEILQIAINYMISILEHAATQNHINENYSINENYLKCYIEIQNNNLEKAVKIFSSIISHPHKLSYSVIEPKSLSDNTIELFDKKVKEMVFK